MRMISGPHNYSDRIFYGNQVSGVSRARDTGSGGRDRKPLFSTRSDGYRPPEKERLNDLSRRASTQHLDSQEKSHRNRRRTENVHSIYVREKCLGGARPGSSGDKEEEARTSDSRSATSSRKKTAIYGDIRALVRSSGGLRNTLVHVQRTA